MSDLRRVLFVEDQPTIFAILELALRKVGGFETYGFATGGDAVSQAALIRPQLFLLDVMMPDLDGPATLALLRKVEGLADVPAVFLTAKVEQTQADRLLVLGAEAVLFKPFDPMTLAGRIRDIWAGALSV